MSGWLLLPALTWGYGRMCCKTVLLAHKRWQICPTLLCFAIKCRLNPLLPQTWPPPWRSGRRHITQITEVTLAQCHWISWTLSRTQTWLMRHVSPVLQKLSAVEKVYYRKTYTWASLTCQHHSQCHVNTEVQLSSVWDRLLCRQCSVIQYLFYFYLYNILHWNE